VAFVVKKVGSVLSPKDVIDYTAKKVHLYKTDMSSTIFELILLVESMLVLEWFSNFNFFFSGRLLHTRRFGKWSSSIRFRGL